MEPEKVHLKKVQSMMNYTIEAIGKGQFDLDAPVYDRDDLGREYRLRCGLELGAKLFTEDEFVGPQRDCVSKAYRALDLQPPSSWVKSEICADLLAHLQEIATGGR